LVSLYIGFGKMAYILSCGLPYLRCKGALEKEGFHNTFEEKENSQDVTLKWQLKNQK
jgi:hypothetical protein